ncbi:MAG TPA: Stk1 family PASTA domain-containing Ser/Thr kinase [Streptosporangiaceae bacterium]|nr:Stk1 family PASTA domain-containing Ser/Thr kinase [Streptosporangiaceae bacterium]
MTQPRLLGGRYELDGVVGRGGMAEVYRARDIRLDRVVAVKTLREDLARDATFQARFRREAQSAASLNHPSIVAVYDTGEDNSGSSHVPYIVMEYVDGQTLRELLRNDRRLLPERALEITDGVLRALDYSHRNGIIHRDIKPGNVMLTRGGQVKVMDFGIARAVSDSQATMTQTAQVIGTAQYLSPEQARGERVDARSDLYSTGCLLYELLTGRPPFLGDSPVAIAYQHVREQPVPPSHLDPDVPRWADAIVLRAMAKDPNERYQSASEMRADIQRALSGMPVSAPPMTAGYGPTQRMGAATGLSMGGPPTQGMQGYDYGQEDGYLPPEGGNRNRTALLWILGLVLVLAVVAGVAYAVFGGGGGVAVPLVQGETQSQAESALTKAGFTFTVQDQSSSTVNKNVVISTNPQGGSMVPKGTKVTLFVSTGPRTVTMPSVRGMPVAAAKAELSGKNYGFQVTVQTATTSTGKPGIVVSQQPRAGRHVLYGATVTIFVPPNGVQIPSVKGDNFATAVATLQGDGFYNITRVAQADPQAQNGTVIGQAPAPGTIASSTTLITLTVVENQPSPPPSPTPTTPSPTPSQSSSQPPGQIPARNHHSVVPSAPTPQP